MISWSGYPDLDPVLEMDCAGRVEVGTVLNINIKAAEKIYEITWTFPL